MHKAHFSAKDVLVTTRKIHSLKVSKVTTVLYVVTYVILYFNESLVERVQGINIKG